MSTALDDTTVDVGSVDEEVTLRHCDDDSVSIGKKTRLSIDGDSICKFSSAKILHRIAELEWTVIICAVISVAVLVVAQLCITHAAVSSFTRQQTAIQQQQLRSQLDWHRKMIGFDRNDALYKHLSD